MTSMRLSFNMLYVCIAVFILPYHRVKILPFCNLEGSESHVRGLEEEDDSVFTPHFLLSSSLIFSPASDHSADDEWRWSRRPR